MSSLIKKLDSLLKSDDARKLEQYAHARVTQKLAS